MKIAKWSNQIAPVASSSLFNMDQPDQSNPVNYAVGQHFLAEIKYPNIPDIISIDKIFNVLQKIKTTSKPLFYKWQTLHRPKRKTNDEEWHNWFAF